jgi:hypothetical protein
VTGALALANQARAPDLGERLAELNEARALEMEAALAAAAAEEDGGHIHAVHAGGEPWLGLGVSCLLIYCCWGRVGDTAHVQHMAARCHRQPHTASAYTCTTRMMQAHMRPPAHTQQ